MIEESRLSLWTMAIATRAQSACMIRHVHLSGLTCDWLMMMRCRRIEGGLKRGRDFTLRSFLSFAGRR
jgi:hypothetical protein